MSEKFNAGRFWFQNQLLCLIQINDVFFFERNLVECFSSAPYNRCMLTMTFSGTSWTTYSVTNGDYTVVDYQWTYLSTDFYCMLVIFLVRSEIQLTRKVTGIKTWLIALNWRREKMARYMFAFLNEHYIFYLIVNPEKVYVTCNYVFDSALTLLVFVWQSAMCVALRQSKQRTNKNLGTCDLNIFFLLSSPLY